MPQLITMRAAISTLALSAAFVIALECTGWVQAQTQMRERVPVPEAANIKYGVNGHDGRDEYPLSNAEARFAWMQKSNLQVYRLDVGTNGSGVLDALVPLGRKYGVTIRPMLYPGTQGATYTLAKRYANDIKVWEIGNEQDAPREGAQQRINQMMQSYRGVQQAESELHAGLQTSINIMTCNPNGASQCQGDVNGDLWFLDMAWNAGFKFNYVTFHYQAHLRDKGYWMDLYFGQMRTAARKYRVPIFLNETHCGEIFDGSTDGGHPGDGGCYDSLNQTLTEVATKYADIIREVTVYEMLDEPRSASGVESHFGVMYALGQPKQTAALLASFATRTPRP